MEKDSKRRRAGLLYQREPGGCSGVNVEVPHGRQRVRIILRVRLAGPETGSASGHPT